MEQITLTFHPQNITWNDHGGYESRNKSTLNLVRDALIRYPPTSPLPSKTVTIHTGDLFKPGCDFSYGIPSAKESHRGFPSFIFDAWPEVGIPSYRDLFDTMVQRGQSPPTDSRAFWIGATTNSLRTACQKLTSQYPRDIDFRILEWNRKDPTSLHTNTSSYVSLPDHCKYRVLVDLGAAGFSARLPLLFASGRSVILADRSVESWFYWEMQPWVHYIPGGSSPESILKAVQWTIDHEDEARQIGEAGRTYAQTYLTADAAIRRCASLLWNHSVS